MRDPFDENEERSTARVRVNVDNHFQEHSQFHISRIWFWWREQTFLEDVWQVIATCWKAFKIPIVIISLITVFMFFANYVDNLEEAKTYEYREVADWTEDYPQIAPHVDIAVSDGILTEGEYETIEEMVEEIEKHISITNARKKVTKALDAQ